MIKILSRGEFIESQTQKIKVFKGKTEIRVHLGTSELLKEELERITSSQYYAQEAVEAIKDVITTNTERLEEAFKKYLPFSGEGAKDEIHNIKEAARQTLSALQVDEEKISSLSEIPFKTPLGIILWRPAPFTSPLEVALKIFTSILSGNHLVITPSPEDAPGVFFLLKFLLSHPYFKKMVSLIPTTFLPKEESIKEASKTYFPIEGIGTTQTLIERRGNSAFVVMEEEGINAALKKSLRAMVNYFGFPPLSPNVILVRESIYYDFLSVLLKNMENLSMEGFGINLQPRLIKIREKVLEAGGKFLIGGLVDDLFKFPAVASELPLSLYLKEELFSPLIFVYTFEKKEEIFDFVASSPAIMSVSIFGGEKEFAMELAEVTPVELIILENSPSPQLFMKLRGREEFLFQGRGPKYLIKEFTSQKLIKLSQD